MANEILQRDDLTDNVAALARGAGWWGDQQENAWREYAAGLDLQQLARFACLTEWAVKEDAADAERVATAHGCPRCGERRMDRLVWQDDVSVRCASCQRVYRLRLVAS